MTVAVRAARPEEFAAVGALTAEAYRVDGLLDEHELPTDAAYEEKLLDAARRARGRAVGCGGHRRRCARQRDLVPGRVALATAGPG